MPLSNECFSPTPHFRRLALPLSLGSMAVTGGLIYNGNTHVLNIFLFFLF